MSDLTDRIRLEADLADRPGQMERLLSIANEIDAYGVAPAGWRIEIGECCHYDPTENHERPHLVQDPTICEGHRNVAPTSTAAS